MGDDTRSIQTRYAGCHFRSRLEARWAVFFDQFGIAWEYEPQGFELTWRLALSDEIIRYLPDFWLPTLDVWAEVKGSWSLDECDKFLNAAASLSSPHGGCGSGQDVVLLGTIPAPMVGWRPYRLHMHKGDLVASAWRPLEAIDWKHSPCIGETIARDVGNDYYRDVRFTNATVAGREARFEFGQSGVR